MATDLSAKDAAAALGISLATLYAYVSRGLVRSAPGPDGRRRRYRADDVARLAAAKAVGRRPDNVAGATLDFGRPVLESALTRITPDALRYRGQDAVELAASATLEDVATLLFGAPPPDGQPPALPEAALAATRHLPPIERCQALLPFAAEPDPPAAEPGRAARRGFRLLAQVIAALTGRASAPPPAHLRFAELWGLDESGAGLVRAALVLCADHELNASTFTVRCIASTGAPLHGCILGGLAALTGPRHGGLTARVEALLDDLARHPAPADGLAARIARGAPIPGLGHPLYPDGDPRARALFRLMGGDQPEIQAARALLGQEPTLDWALVALARRLGLPPGAPLTLFAAGRTVGWIAHALEQRRQGRLIRPRARYVGPE